MVRNSLDKITGWDMPRVEREHSGARTNVSKTDVFLFKKERRAENESPSLHSESFPAQTNDTLYSLNMKKQRRCFPLWQMALFLVASCNSERRLPRTALLSRRFPLALCLVFRQSAAMIAGIKRLTAPSQGVYLRILPSTSAGEIALLSSDDYVKILDASVANWYRVASWQGTGWVSANYISLIKK